MSIEISSVISIATIVIASFSVGGLYVSVRSASERQREILTAIEKLGLSLAELHREHSVLEQRVEDFISEFKRSFQRQNTDTLRGFPSRNTPRTG